LTTQELRAIPAKKSQEINHGSMEMPMVIDQETLEELLMISLSLKIVQILWL
jgi:hypothetical protein